MVFISLNPLISANSLIGYTHTKGAVPKCVIILIQPFFLLQKSPVSSIRNQELPAEGEAERPFLMRAASTFSWYASAYSKGIPKHLLRILDACPKPDAASWKRENIGNPGIYPIIRHFWEPAIFRKLDIKRTNIEKIKLSEQKFNYIGYEI